MTLHNYKLHKNTLQKSSIEKSETIDISKWIPQELDDSILKSINRELEITDPTDEEIFNSITNTERVDVNDAEITPSTVEDSRSLIENKIQTNLSLEEQEGVRNNMIIMISEAINDAQRNKVHIYSDKRQEVYNNGIQIALTIALSDLNSGMCLYEVIERYSEDASLYLKLLEKEPDVEEFDYPQTRYKGIASGYINLANVIKEKLGQAEQMKYKLNDIPNPK
jgi:hypothetical protein